MNDFEVTIIDKRDHWDFVIGAPRMLNKDGLIDRWDTPFLESVKGYGNKYKYIQAELTSVNKNNSIKVKVANGGAQTISYDYLILATGFHYPLPVKNNDALILDDRKKQIKEEAQKIMNASSILVVGSGAVGVEFVGELYHQYGDKKRIGIATRGSRLLSHFP
jgi:NADH dehydrogenase FAD-containing subunit